MWELFAMFAGKTLANHETGQVGLFCQFGGAVSKADFSATFSLRLGGWEGPRKHSLFYKLTFHYTVMSARHKSPNFNCAEQHHWPLNLFRRWKTLDTSW